MISGAAWGTLAHLVRDIAVGPGVPLWSPVPAQTSACRTPLYAAALLALALISPCKIA